MVVPIFARLHAVAAADAFGRVEQNASRLAVLEPSCRHEVAVLLSQSFGLILSHASPFPTLAKIYQRVYHLTFMGVNKITAEDRGLKIDLWVDGKIALVFYHW
jgi:hypothetical protein